MQYLLYHTFALFWRTGNEVVTRQQQRWVASPRWHHRCWCCRNVHMIRIYICRKKNCPATKKVTHPRGVKRHTCIKDADDDSGRGVGEILDWTTEYLDRLFAIHTHHMRNTIWLQATDQQTDRLADSTLIVLYAIVVLLRRGGRPPRAVTTISSIY